MQGSVTRRVSRLGFTTVLRRTAVAAVVLAGSLTLATLPAGVAAADSPPTITGVAFGGTTSPAQGATTVTVTGSGFGTESALGTPYAPPPSGATGSDFVDDNLHFTDTTGAYDGVGQWDAGGESDPSNNLGSWVGLVILSYTDTQIVFTFGIPGYYGDPWAVTAGDGFTMDALGATYSGTAAFSDVDVTVDGSQPYGGSPTFTSTNDAPAGVTLSGAPACTWATDGPITSSTPAGPHTLDGSTCSGVTPSDPSYAVVYIGDADGFDVTADSTTTHLTVVGPGQVYGHEDGATFDVSVLTGHGEDVPDGDLVNVGVGTASCTATLVGGAGMCSLSGSALAKGTYAATATYAGDSDLQSSTSGAAAFTVVQPTITAVTYGGSFTSPTITIWGSGFGTRSFLGAPQTPSTCGGSGSDYAGTISLHDSSTSPQNDAGALGDCIGLVISSYSDSQIVLSPGSTYGTPGYGPDDFGDSISVNVLGASYSGTVPVWTSPPPGQVTGPFAYAVDFGNGTTPGTVTPISVATGATAPAITVGIGPSAVAVSPDGATVYVTDAGSDSVTPIATATNTAGTPISVGSQPDAIAITPDGTTAYVADHGDATVTPIDLASRTAGSPSRSAATPRPSPSPRTAPPPTSSTPSAT